MTDRAAFKDAVREALIDRAEALFVLAWGEPARQGGREWRARANDALSMQMQGADRGKWFCLLYTSPSPRDGLLSRMPSSA